MRRRNQFGEEGEHCLALVSTIFSSNLLNKEHSIYNEAAYLI